MIQSEWTELKRVFAEACELGPQERSALLDQRCAGKPELRAEVEAYLRQHERLGSRTPGGSQSPRGEAAGTRIGRYRLVERIGEGGFGTVWMAEQEEPLKRMVALKLLKPGMDSKAVLARFDVERQALALMEHPGIARILDGGTTEEGRPYFVMELVRGLPITRYCDEHGSSTAERLALFREVCLAVQHAHYKGVIHRDLKPSNVLVAEQDGKPQPKVIDFGVAKATELQLTEKTLATGIDQLIGTPDYMAPEQAAPGNADIDTRADVYALGILLYELLAGSRPFDMRALFAKGLEEVLRTLREVEPERPSLRKPALAGDLDWLVMRALEKDRSRRYPTVQDFADDVTRFLRHEPLSAGPPSATYRLRKFVRRNRVGVAAAAAVGLALVAGTAVAWRAYYVAEERRVFAEQKGKEADEQRSAAVQSAALEKAARETAVAKEAEAQRELARSAFFIKLLYDMLGSADPHQSRSANLSVREMLEQFEIELEPRLAQEPEVRIGAHLVLAHAWLGLGCGQRAHTILDTVQAELAEHPLQTEEAEYLRLEAERLHDEHEWLRAIELTRREIEIRNAQDGREGNPESLEARIFLEDLHQHAGQFAEAESQVRALLVELEGLEPRDPGLERVAHSTLAKVLLATGRLPEAEELLRSSIDSEPAESLARLRTSVSLAATLLRQGRFAEGEELLRDVGPRLRARLGDQHPECRDFLQNLGVALLAQGKAGEAEQVDREALAIARKANLPGSSLLVAPLSELGTALFMQGRAEEALPFAMEALEIRRLKFPGDEPDLARCVENVSSALYRLSRFEQALPLLVESVELRRAGLPAAREDLDYSLITYADVLLVLGRFSEAEAALRERMQLYESAAEDPPALRCQALRGLGRALVGLERWTEAEASLREAVQAFEAQAKPGNWALESARSLLGAALAGAGSSAEGGELLRSAAKRIRPPPLHKEEKRLALERLLRYLEGSGQDAEATAVRAQLEQLP